MDELYLLLGCLVFACPLTKATNSSTWTKSVFVGKNGFEKTLLRENWSQRNLDAQVPTGSVSETCMEYLQQFSNATAKFINCTVANARPLHYCENCVGEYMSVNNIYNIMLDEDNPNKTVDCKKEILMADNVQVVLVTYNFIIGIWSKSTCDKCFEVNKTSHQDIYHPAKSTTKLLRLIEDALDCFNDFGHGDVPGNENKTVCELCKNLYCKANDYYEEVETKKRLCSDLIDSMNYTRLEWGHRFGCSAAMRDHGEIWEIAAFVFALPLLFYLGIWVHANQDFIIRRTAIRHSRLTNSE